MQHRRLEVRLYKRRCERFLRTKLGIFVLLTVVMLVLLLIYSRFYSNGQSVAAESSHRVASFEVPEVIRAQHKGETPLCRAPFSSHSNNYSAEHSFLLPTPKTPPQCNCDEYENLIFIDNNHLQMNKTHPSRDDLTECSFRAIELRNDHRIVYSQAKTVSASDLKSKIFMANHDFITAINFKKGNGEEITKKYHLVQALPKNSIHNRINAQNGETMRKKRPDVLVLHIGKIGYHNVEEQLPKTVAILRDYQALRFSGYNSLGDHVRDNVIPLLSGKSKVEFFKMADKVNRGKNEEIGPDKVLDNLNLLWYDYERLGYSTLFAEDTADDRRSVFNTESAGFAEPPTDHYMRPFWKAVDEKSCLGCHHRHVYAFDYLRDFFVDYANVSKFAVYVHHEEAAENLDVTHLDDDISKFFNFLIDGKYIDNLVILLHGDTHTNLSEEIYSKNSVLSRNLGFVSLVIPKWMKIDYWSLSTNLIRNSGRFSTAYDLNLLLRDILTVTDDNFKDNAPESDVRNRGHSPLRDFPLGKNCASSAVPLAWCSCLRIENVNKHFISDADVKEAKAKILGYFHFIRKVTKKCRLVKKIDILYADIFVPKTEQNVRRPGRPKEIRGSSNIGVYYVHLIMRTDTRETFMSVVEFDRKANFFRVFPDFRRLDEVTDDSCEAKKGLQGQQRKICLC